MWEKRRPGRARPLGPGPAPATAAPSTEHGVRTESPTPFDRTDNLESRREEGCRVRRCEADQSGGTEGTPT